MRSTSLFSFVVCIGVTLASPFVASTARIEFSHARGMYSDPFQLSLSSTPGATILYTTDGSVPSRSDQSYEGPIKIDGMTVVRAATLENDQVSPEVTTHTYLFPAKVWQQPAEPPGYVRSTISMRHGPSRPQTFDWAMDPELLKTERDREILLTGLNDLPSLAVSMELTDFNYLYENHRQRGRAFERPASIELIYPQQTRYARFEGFQIDCGIRMHGGLAVDQARKKSFRVLFKKQYGAGKLKYPVFESAAHHGSSAANRYDTLVLRSGGNGNWSKDAAWKHEPGVYLRDTLVRDSQIAISGFGSRSTFVHLYINGLYFGVYNIAERPECKFMAAYFGGEPEDYYAINHHGTVDGDATRWQQIVSGNNLDQHVDTQSFCDYLILNWAVGMGDWPWNNYYAGVRNNPPGRIRFFAWDAEYAFWTIPGYLGSNPGAWANPIFLGNRDLRRPTPIVDIWRALAADAEFKMTFADRIYRHFVDGGQLTDEKLGKRFQRLVSQLDKAIIAESCRWGDAAWGREDNPHIRATDYRPNCEKIARLIEGNAAKFISAMRDSGYYPEIEAPNLATPLPAETEFVARGTKLQFRPPARSSDVIYYTTDDDDPRLRGGLPNPRASRWSAHAPALEITAATELRARAFRDGQWSPLFERTLLLTAQGFPLRITELMYHPSANTADEPLEFIELQNISNAALRVGGFHFTGVEYLFPPNAKLKPQQIIVLIPNDAPDRFRDRYPNAEVFGLYRQDLSNSGERVAVHNADGKVVTELTYQTADGWPDSASGTGMSIHLQDVSARQAAAHNWKAGACTPGQR